MPPVRRFQDLVCYQLARELRQAVSGLIDNSTLSVDRELCDQLRRAARSVTGNIAEGFPCPSHAEFARFLDMAARSIREIEDRLVEGLDRHLLSDRDAAPALNLAKRTAVAVSRLTAYLRRTPGATPRR